MQTIQSIAGATLATAIIATGMTVAAAPAEARVAPGGYWYTAWNARTGERVVNRPARVVGNRIYVDGARFTIRSTPRGGYFEEFGMRSVFWRAGNGYDGRRESVYAAPLRLRLARL